MVALLAPRSMMWLLATGLAAAAAGCGGGPELRRELTVQAGAATVLALEPKNGPRLVLQNQSSAPPAEVYSRADDRLRKVVPDPELQSLLDLFAGEELFTFAVPSVPPNARDVLRLAHGGREWLWVRRGVADDPAEAAFQNARAYFLAVYNGNEAFHSGEERPDFRSESQRAQRDAEATRARLRSLQRAGNGGVR